MTIMKYCQLELNFKPTRVTLARQREIYGQMSNIWQYNCLLLLTNTAR